MGTKAVIIFCVVLTVIAAVITAVILLGKSNKDSETLARLKENFSNKPSVCEVDFDFKKACRQKKGAVYLYNSDDSDLPFSGTLLGCEQRVEYGDNPAIFFSEIEQLQSLIDSGAVSPKNERERLVLYHSIVYPNAPSKFFENMTLRQLVELYQEYEFYYKLPVEVMPKTEILIHRDSQNSFYRTPVGVVLDQDPDRLGLETAYAEVAHFGSTSSLFREPGIFTGTYYYPVKGSGIFLPLGQTLVAYNKVHALKLLDTLNTDILQVGGTDFQSFLQDDSEGMWQEIKKLDSNANREDYWVSACVVDKHSTETNEECGQIFGYNTKKIWYIPAALDRMIDEMVAGKSLRIATRTVDGKDKKVKVYYGLGDTGDMLLGQTGRDRGYDTIQLLREAQMSLTGDAVVGNEIAHLVEPVYSQSSLARLNPFLRPYFAGTDAFLKPHVNYLLDQSISGVKVDMVTDDVFDPWETEQVLINVVVPERNDSGTHDSGGR